MKSYHIKIVAPVAYLLAVIAYFLLIVDFHTIQFHQTIGMLLTLVAFAGWIVARIQLGSAFSIGAKAKTLVTTGLYSKLRHPVYYFSILALLGIAIFSWNAWLLVIIAVLTLLEVARIRQEEKTLAQKFGARYARYRAKTWF